MHANLDRRRPERLKPIAPPKELKIHEETKSPLFADKRSTRNLSLSSSVRPAMFAQFVLNVFECVFLFFSLVTLYGPLVTRTAIRSEYKLL